MRIEMRIETSRNRLKVLGVRRYRSTIPRWRAICLYLRWFSLALTWRAGGQS